MAGKRATQTGMTLIELLIAVAIGAIVLAALNSVVSLGLQAQSTGRQGNELVYQARFALERMITTARGVSPSVVIAATPNASTTCGGGTAVTATAGGTTVTLPAGRSIPANGSCTLTVDVTAPFGGSYTNMLPAGALVTSNGNNSAPVLVTSLTVIPPGTTLPMLGNAFSLATINMGGVSTITITLSNPNAAVATLTAALVDTLLDGVMIATPPNASTTCGGVGAPVAVAGGSTVTLPAGRSIPANGNCTLKVDVTAPAGGSYTNTLPAGALVTSNGNNAAPTAATLIVIRPGPIVPSLGTAFSPATINAGGVSTLTITLSNPNVSVATLTAPLIDALRSGVMVILATPPNDTTGNWFCPVMYNRNGSQLIETTYANNNCTGSTGTTVIASNVSAFSAVLRPDAGRLDKPVAALSLTLDNTAAPQTVYLSTSVRLGGGTR